MNRMEAIEILENGDFWDLCVIPYVYSDRPAVEFHEALDTAIAALRAQQELNDPLTLEQLREMDGQPVWITPGGFWALVIARRGERVRLINHEGESVMLNGIKVLWLGS